MISPDDPRLMFVTLTELTTPKDYYSVLVNHWWIYHKESNSVIFYKTSGKSKHIAPQCNPNKQVAEIVLKRLYPWAELIQIPAAYIKREDN